MSRFTEAVRAVRDRMLSPFLSRRTRRLVVFDLRRWRTRVKRRLLGSPAPTSRKLHLGCGQRRVPGWFNVDIKRSACDVDLGAGWLPWRDDAFDAVVSQHVIEHLELTEQVLPLLRELRRVIADDGELWLSCPDIEKICRSYLDHGMADLYEARLERTPQWALGEIPTVHLINDMFHQRGQHRNLFDLELLTWGLNGAGFTDVTRVDEATLIERFPEFPWRHDDEHTLYVCAK